MSRCDQCEYVPLTQYTSVRAQPWTSDDQGLNFFTCKRCGAVTVQRFDARTSYGQVWMLDAEVMTLLRMDAAPQRVVDYLLSDDYRANKAISFGLFAGWAKHSLALAVVTRGLLGALPDRKGRRIIEILEMIKLAMVELTHRASLGEQVVLRDADFVVAVLEGQQSAGLRPSDEARARILALEILELVVDPRLVGALEPEHESYIEAAIEHGNLVGRSRSEISRAAKSLGDQGLQRLIAEGQFLYDLLDRRQAFLPKGMTEVVWEALLGTYSRMNGELGPKAFLALQALVELQLVHRGLEPITWRERGHSFLHPRHGWVLYIPELEPRFEMFSGINEARLLGTFGTWEEVERITA